MVNEKRTPQLGNLAGKQGSVSNNGGPGTEMIIQESGQGFTDNSGPKETFIGGGSERFNRMMQEEYTS